MKVKLIIFFVCTAIAFLPIFGITKAIIPDYEIINENVAEPLVFVTTYGEKYHNKRCHYLKQSKHAKGKEKAISEGYTACSYCHGVSEQIIIVEYEKVTPINNTNKCLVVAFCMSFLTACIFSPFFTILRRKSQRKCK